MQRNFPVEIEPFVTSLHRFFGTAATQDRRSLSIEQLREQFFELMPYDKETVVKILAHWQNDRSAASAELGEAAQAAHKKHGQLPNFPTDVIVSYAANTLADAYEI